MSIVARLQEAAEGNPESRERFLAALRERPAGPEVADLARAVDHGDGRVRLLAIEALGGVGGDVAARALKRAVLGRDLAARARAVEMLARLGPGALRPLCDLAAHPSWDIRARAVQALGSVGDPLGVPVLCLLLVSDPHELVRIRCAVALGPFPAAEAVGPLVLALADRSATVRVRAATVLGKSGHERPIAPLACCLRPAELPALRRAAAAALQELGWDAATGSLAQQVVYALTLGNASPPAAGGRAAVPVLVQCLEQEDESLRAGAARGLQWVAENNPCPELSAALPPLKRLAGRRESQESHGVLSAAYRAIQDRLDGAHRLPLPAAAPGVPRELLPRPADPAELDPAQLPRPAVSGPSGTESPRGWRRFAFWARGRSGRADGPQR